MFLLFTKLHLQNIIGNIEYGKFWKMYCMFLNVDIVYDM